MFAGTKPLRTITIHALLLEYLYAHKTYSAPAAPNAVQLWVKDGVLYPPVSSDICAQLIPQAAVTLFGTASARDDSGWQLTPTAVPGWHAYLVTALANWPRPPQAIAGAALLQRAVDNDSAFADAARALLVLSVALVRLAGYFLPPEVGMRAAEVLLSAPDTMPSAICFLRYKVKAGRNEMCAVNEAAASAKVARALAHGDDVYTAQALSSFAGGSSILDVLPNAGRPVTINTGMWHFKPSAEDPSAYACGALMGQSLKLEDSMSLPAVGLACICKLTALQSLDVSNCHWITQDSARHVSNLVHLTALNMSGCGWLAAVPDGISKLCALQTLNLSGCNGLQELPDSIGTLRALQRLELSCCKRLQELPDSIGTLRALQKLNLSWCVRLQELPGSIGTLSALQTLMLDGCRELQCLPDSIGELSAR